MSLKRKLTEEKHSGESIDKPEYAKYLRHTRRPPRTDTETKEIVQELEDRDTEITEFLLKIFVEAITYFPADEDDEKNEDLFNFLCNGSLENVNETLETMRTEWLNSAKSLLAQHIVTNKTSLDKVLTPNEKGYGLRVETRTSERENDMAYMFTSVPWRTIMMLYFMNTYEPRFSVIRLIEKLEKNLECERSFVAEQVSEYGEEEGITLPMFIPKNQSVCTISLVVYTD